MTGQVASIEASEVGSAARRGAAWTFIQLGGRHVVSLGSTAVLARLLTADQYGVVGMTTTLTALLTVFAGMGLSWATIQRRDLTEAQVSNLFWLNVGSGFLLWLVGCVLAAPLADFYAREEVRLILMVSGVNFLFTAIAAQPIALLIRTMKFRTLALIELGSLLVGATVGIAMAASGFGYWALVAQLACTNATRAVVGYLLSGFRLLPPRANTGTIALARFGAVVAVNNLMLYAASNLDGVFVGRVLGAEALGLYNRAYFLMLLPSMLASTAIGRLMMPALSALQFDKPRFGSAYRRALRLTAFVACPMAMGMALAAHELVLVVYGDRWDTVASLLVWLSVAGLVHPIYNTVGWLFVAAGKASMNLITSAMNAGVLAVVFALTVGHGLESLSAAYSVAMGLVLFVPSMWLAHRAASIPLWASFRSLAPVGVAVTIMAICVLLVSQVAVAYQWEWHWALAAKVVTGIISYGARVTVAPQGHARAGRARLTAAFA